MYLPRPVIAWHSAKLCCSPLHHWLSFSCFSHCGLYSIFPCFFFWRKKVKGTGESVIVEDPCLHSELHQISRGYQQMACGVGVMGFVKKKKRWDKDVRWQARGAANKNSHMAQTNMLSSYEFNFGRAFLPSICSDVIISKLNTGRDVGNTQQGHFGETAISFKCVVKWYMAFLLLISFSLRSHLTYPCCGHLWPTLGSHCIHVLSAGMLPGRQACRAHNGKHIAHC